MGRVFQCRITLPAEIGVRIPSLPLFYKKLDTTHLRMNRKAADNKVFEIAGGPCFADTFVQDGSSVPE